MPANPSRYQRLPPTVPRIEELGLPDDTLTLALRGYPFIRDTCRRLGRDVFDTRFFLERTTCMTGPKAAALFSDPSCVERSRSAFAFPLNSLFEQGGGQLFFPSIDDAALSTLVSFATQKWTSRMAHWERQREVVVLDDLTKFFCETMMQWCCIPFTDLAGKARDFRLLIEAGSPTNANHPRAKTARRRLELWLEQSVEDERRNHAAPQESVFARFCRHVDPFGRLPPARLVAAELNHLVRPTVAVAWYCAALAAAMHHHPDLIPKADDEGAQGRFVAEVRRLHPFSPMIAGRVKRSTEFGGQSLSQGRLVLLDVFGTNRDTRTYEAPEKFWPQRFERTETHALAYISTEGGEPFSSPQAPGQWLTQELMMLCMRQLMRLSYSVPRQDLSTSWTQIPARPASGVVLREVRRRDIRPAPFLIRPPRKAKEESLPEEQDAPRARAR